MLSSSSDGKFLEIGCFIGHDIRRLAVDLEKRSGENCSSRLSGMDVVSVWDVRFDYFRNRAKFGAKFCLSDILEVGECQATELKGKVDAIAIFFVPMRKMWEQVAEETGIQLRRTHSKAIEFED